MQLSMYSQHWTSLMICTGNHEEQFVSYVLGHKGSIKNLSGVQHMSCCMIISDTGESVTAYLDNSLPPQQTVRHKSCELLLQGDTDIPRCHRDIAQVSDPSSHINFIFMKMPEKDARLRGLHRERVPKRNACLS